MALFVPLFYFFAIVVTKYGKIGQSFFLKFLGIPAGIWLTLYGSYATITVDEKQIEKKSSIFMSSRRLEWKDVKSVIDDAFFYSLPFGHKYNLIPKQELFKRKKEWIIIQDCFKNYRDLLKEVVLRVSPDTKVDASILKLTSLAQQDIGRLYKQVESQ